MTDTNTNNGTNNGTNNDFVWWANPTHLAVHRDARALREGRIRLGLLRAIRALRRAGGIVDVWSQEGAGVQLRIARSVASRDSWHTHRRIQLERAHARVQLASRAGVETLRAAMREAV